MATENTASFPTIAHLKAQGVASVCPFCRSCGQSGGVAFESLGLPDSTPFPLIARATRFRCLACGVRDYAVMPDSSGYRALGMGQICRSMPVQLRHPLTTSSDAKGILPAAGMRHVQRSPSGVTIVRNRRKAEILQRKQRWPLGDYRRTYAEMRRRAKSNKAALRRPLKR